MWSELSDAWKVSFGQAWEAYCKGSIPIGAALVNDKDVVISTGRSMVNEKEAPFGHICWSKLSHAELNALLQVSAHEHNNIRAYTLYTTMEPCPLCFGALVISNVRNLRYAARDKFGGSTNLSQANEYIKSKPLKIFGPFESLEVVSVALNTEYALRAWGEHHGENVISAWNENCPAGVSLGRRLYQEKTLGTAKQNGLSISSIFDEVLQRCSE